MLERFQFAVCSWCPGRTVSVLIAALALACNTWKAPATGQLQLVASEGGSPSDASPKATFVGSLELRSLRDGALSAIPIQGLSPGSTLRRELPAGLYAMAWTRDEEEGGEVGSSRVAHDLPLVAIIAGQVTKLMVRQPEACSLPQRAALASEARDLGEAHGLASLDTP